jgi:5-methylcytosine-specific restriction endonuclease McrA
MGLQREKGEEMTRLVTLFQAVQNDAREDIDAYLEALKQETANTRLAELGDYYRFKTFWDAEIFDGNRVMLAQDLAQLMYDTSDVSGLGRLLRRYGLDSYTVGGSVHGVRNLLKTHFNLSRYAPQVSFATYRHFLMAGMKGETDLARKVCSYLLKMEEDGRVNEAMPKPRSAIELLREGLYEVDTKADGAVKDAREAKVIAINAQHTALSVKKKLLDENAARLKRAQSYLPGEFQARMRSLVNEFANYHCLRCHHEMTLEENLLHSIEVDEVFPRAHGGNRTWDNVQAICRDCNGLKRDAAQRGEFMGRWDFRTSTFRAACEREQRKYNRRMQRRENPMPLFPDEGVAG